MTAVETTAAVFIPPGKIESTGIATLFLKCDTESSGVGLSTAVMPLYSPSYALPSGALNLFVEAKNQVGLWGHSLYDAWGSYNVESWSSWPSGSKPALGYNTANINMAISGQKLLSFNAVMPLYQPVSATGNASGFFNLYTLNQEVSTGTMNMTQTGHELYGSGLSLFTEGNYVASSGTINLVATGIGHSDGTLGLVTFSFGV